MAKKPYKITKEKSETGEGTVYRYTCRADPSITGTATSIETAIFWGEYYCGHGRSLKDAEFGRPGPPASHNPDFASCQSCSKKLVLRSSLYDFQTLKS
jgi:hypothetical protein